MRSPATHGRPVRGVTLIELLLAIVFLSAAIVAISDATSHAERSLAISREALVADALVNEITEEITRLPRRLPGAPGPENAARATGAAASAGHPEVGVTAPRRRSDFESPLDYDGLVEEPPRDRDGREIAAREGWRREFLAFAVDPEEPARRVAESEERLVRITIVISRGGRELRRAEVLRSAR